MYIYICIYIYIYIIRAPRSSFSIQQPQRQQQGPRVPGFQGTCVVAFFKCFLFSLAIHGLPHERVDSGWSRFRGDSLVHSWLVECRSETCRTGCSDSRRRLRVPVHKHVPARVCDHLVEFGVGWPLGATGSFALAQLRPPTTKVQRLVPTRCLSHQDPEWECITGRARSVWSGLCTRGW